MRARFDQLNNVIYVTLSERNLLALLTKLSQEGSARTIYTNNDIGNLGALVVTSERDDVHYGDRRPGPMSQDTEADIEDFKVGLSE